MRRRAANGSWTSTFPTRSRDSSWRDGSNASRRRRAGGSASGCRRRRASSTAGRPRPRRGAIVTVVDGAGRAYPFPEIEPGLYGTEHLVGRVGEAYTLFSSSTRETCTRRRLCCGKCPPIDSLYFEFEEESLFIEEEGYRATIDFADPAGVPNHYLWEQLVEGVNEIPPDPGNAINLVSRDELYDGRDVIGFQPNDEIAIAPGEHAAVRQISLSRLGYDYYYALFEQNALGSANPFSIPPANVRGNVTNLDRPSRFAFGFFGAAEVSVAEGGRARPVEDRRRRARIRPAGLCSLPCSMIPPL